MRIPFLASVCLLLLAASSSAQTSISVEDAPCLLVLQNGVIKAQVANNLPETAARLYFRRLHEEVEDFYWVEMQPKGNGEYWGVLPKAQDEVLEPREARDVAQEVRERSAAWWRLKEELANRNPNLDLDQDVIIERASVGRNTGRDWMGNYDDQALEEWLEGLEYEPAEYYAALYDAFGKEITRSALHVARVTNDCSTSLSASEAGLAQNLTVGETATWQQGEEVFHWGCDGVVSRVDVNGVWRGDSICRACLVSTLR